MIHKLQITAAVKNDRTILKDCFFTQPFRVANISEDRNDPRLYLMVMSSSPGLLNEDEYAIDINVEAGGELMLQSQAYQRIFKMKGTARIHQEINILQNATLYYVPHPVVPHTGSTLISETKINLYEDSRLLFGDIVTCGRKHSGELFQYTSFTNRLTLTYNGRTIFKDNIILKPSSGHRSGIGQFEGFTHQAGFLFADTQRKIDVSVLDNLHEILQSDGSISSGITQTHDHLVAGRLLATGAEQLYAMLKRVERFAADYWSKVKERKPIVQSIEPATV